MKLFFRQEGEGFPFVIVHGLYGSSDNWLTIGKKLSAHFRVYMIDQRNHGQSPHSNDHSYQLMADDLAEFFEQQNIEKAILMGHSMGGKTAMYFAADYPEKVEKLIIADIAPKDYFQLKEDSQYYLHTNILLAMQEIDFSRISSRTEVGDYLLEKIDNPHVVQFLLKNVHRNKKTNEFEWRLNAKVLYENLDEIIGGVNEHWFADRMPIFSYPVLFIKGEKSNYILDNDRTAIRKIYPDSTIKIIPNAGHWLHAEQPELFLKTIEEFA